jgi:hypothetical protein
MSLITKEEKKIERGWVLSKFFMVLFMLNNLLFILFFVI